MEKKVAVIQKPKEIVEDVTVCPGLLPPLPLRRPSPDTPADFYSSKSKRLSMCGRGSESVSAWVWRPTPRQTTKEPFLSIIDSASAASRRRCFRAERRGLHLRDRARFCRRPERRARDQRRLCVDRVFPPPIGSGFTRTHADRAIVALRRRCDGAAMTLTTLIGQDGVSVRNMSLVEIRELTVNEEVAPPVAPLSLAATRRRIGVATLFIVLLSGTRPSGARIDG
jgi:hypothetical protein